MPKQSNANAPKVEFTLTISENGAPVLTVPLPYTSVSTIVDDIPENHELSDQFCLLAAQHPASQVRQRVANRDKLSEETMAILAKDTSVDVLRNLIRSAAFQEYADQDLLARFVQISTDLAEAIADNLGSFSNANAEALVQLLLQMDDPAIAYNLAGNYNIPKKILRSLLKHNDLVVSQVAKNTLD